MPSLIIIQLKWNSLSRISLHRHCVLDTGLQNQQAFKTCKSFSIRRFTLNNYSINQSVSNTADGAFLSGISLLRHCVLLDMGLQNQQVFRTCKSFSMRRFTLNNYSINQSVSNTADGAFLSGISLLRHCVLLDMGLQNQQVFRTCKSFSMRRFTLNNYSINQSVINTAVSSFSAFNFQFLSDQIIYVQL